MKRTKYFAPCIVVILKLMVLQDKTFAQSAMERDTSDISTLNLAELMQYKSQGIPSALETKINSSVEVASITPMVVRKSPNIISVITDEEIRNSGARDLTDILKMVPGIDFGVDVEGAVGIAIRGNWAHEAKVLMQINGIGLNETVYGTLQFANRYPIDQIKKIEIIRGPGSVIYGGEAEYAVINIITKNGEDLNGVQVNSFCGRFQNTTESNNFTLAIGKKQKDFNFSLINFFGDGIRSDQTYTDIYGSSYDMSNNSRIRPMNFLLNLNYKNFSVEGYYDKMVTETRDAYDAILSRAYNESFSTMRIGAKYDWVLSEKLTITNKLSMKRTIPWEVTESANGDSTEALEVLYKTVADRYKANITGIWTLSKNILITIGTEEFYDVGKKFDGDVFRNSNKDKVSYFNSSGFTQAIVKNKIVNLTVGARYDQNSSFGSDFVPRAGLTKRIGKFNLKLLYSNSFKAPVIENVETSLSGDIKPEKTRIWEFEPSVQINKNMFLTLNLYDLTTHHTIIYVVDTLTTGVPDGYINGDLSGSRGVELEYKFIGKWGYMNFGVSLFSNQNKCIVPEYGYPLKEHEVLAFAKQKITLNTSFNLTPTLFISPSFLYFSKRNGITAADEEGNYLYREYPETFYANLFIGKKQLFIKGLEAGMGVYDIFNQKTIYIQPYNSGHAPLPGPSREYFIRLTFSSPFQLQR